MNTLVLVLISMAVLVCGYLFYGRWLCRQRSEEHTSELQSPS